MAKPSIPQQFTTETEIRDHAERNDSFGFEMRVGAVLAKSPVEHVEHGGTYADPITGFLRQFDFRCDFTDGRRCLRFSIECKNIDPTLPVIVCGRSRPISEAYHEVIISTSHATGPRSVRKRVGSSRYIGHEDFVGKSVLKPERDGNGQIRQKSGDAEVHERWSQALASAHNLVEAASKNGSGTCTVVVPVLVMPDDALWRVWYGDDGKPSKLAKVKECAYYVARRYDPQPENRHEPIVLSHILFLTISGLTDLLENLKRPALDWDHWIPDEILEEYRQQ